MQPDTQMKNLVRMANQIGQFFKTQGVDTAAAGIADHIEKFWDPRMRQLIRAHARAGGAGLDPHALEAVRQLDEQGRVR